MKARLGISGQIFGSLGQHEINIKTISQGADEISIMIGVDQKDYEKAISTIYHQFIL